MNQRVSITLSEDVYESLKRTVGPDRISEFIDALARPHVVPQDIDATYRDMAADQAREQKALEWAEGVIADASVAEPRASR